MKFRRIKRVVQAITRMITIFSWVPLLIGGIGYGVFMGMGFWEAIYAAAALYFVNPVTDENNDWVMVAKILAIVVAANVVLEIIKTVYSLVAQSFIKLFSDSTAVYSDNEWGRQLANNMKHGYLADNDDGDPEPEDTKDHILMFSDDLKNIQFYLENKKHFRNKRVYMLLNDMDSFLMKPLNPEMEKTVKELAKEQRELEKENAKREKQIAKRKAEQEAKIEAAKKAGKEVGPEDFPIEIPEEPEKKKKKSKDTSSLCVFNIYEVMARKYWRTYNLYDKKEQPILKIAILGYGKVGQAIFKYGYLNNIYNLNQIIEYHVWGCDEIQGEFLRKLDCSNDDAIFVHDKRYEEEFELIASMDRVIITEGDVIGALQNLIYENNDLEVHCYSEQMGEGQMQEVYAAKNLATFGNFEEMLCEEEIKKESLYRIGKLCNYDYDLRYADEEDKKNGKPATRQKKLADDYEYEMEMAWRKLSGFTKGSNVARADHLWIERRLKAEAKENGTEIPEEVFWRMEHFRWCRFHYINHWKYADIKKKNADKRLHPLLVDYEELDPLNQSKDGFYNEEIDRMIEETLKKAEQGNNKSAK